jgi:hypothetical protein
MCVMSHGRREFVTREAFEMEGCASGLTPDKSKTPNTAEDSTAEDSTASQPEARVARYDNINALCC